MRNSKWIKGGLASVGLMFGAATSWATESGFYLGLDYGQSSFDIENESLGIFDVTTSFGTEDSDSAWSLAMGYRFNPNFGMELAYNELGAATYYETGRDYAPAIYGRVDADVEVKGTSLSLVGAIPVNNWEFSGKLGLFLAKTSLSATAFIIPGPVAGTAAASESASTSETMVGIGVGYTFAEHVHVKVGYTMFSDVGDEEKTGEGDVTTLTAGVQFRF